MNQYLYHHQGTCAICGLTTVCLAGRHLPIPRLSGQDGVIYSSAVKSLQDLRDDDDAAAAEQAAQGNRPGYCGAAPACSICMM